VPNPGYIAAALAVAVAITVTLRALPFGMRNAMKESALLADIGRWMPLGAITILAAYRLTTINVTTPTHGIPELTGVAATIAIHWWPRNAVLSIVTGTAACLVMTNWVLPT
jgi:branched-subunit amino acid transport protein AzlD